ncbi:MAG: hypothetical protein RL336_1802 [Pseudomonadota bacterium]|jgi:phosphate transport system permease protein
MIASKTTKKSALVSSQRRWIDKLVSAFVRLGGMSVLLLSSLIVFYLVYEVAPLFKPAQVETVAQFTVPASASTHYLYVEEQDEIAMRITADGEVVFFSAQDGGEITRRNILARGASQVTSVGVFNAASRELAVGFDNGVVRLLSHQYKSRFKDGVRTIIPSIQFLYEDFPLRLADSPIEQITIGQSDEALLVVGVANERLKAALFAKQQDPIFGDTTLAPRELDIPTIDIQSKGLVLDSSLKWLFALGHNNLSILDLTNMLQGAVTLHSRREVFGATSINKLAGGISVLIGYENGRIEQSFMTRSNDTWDFSLVRTFDTQDTSSVIGFLPEQRRKGFVALNRDGAFDIYHSTARRHLYGAQYESGVVHAWSMSPRASAILLEHGDNQYRLLHVTNSHPEISWQVLWDKIWYESYPEPDYIWQSSSSDVEFEPKYSLMPLAFGTLKAAFYAMLLASPLAICAAIYTAYFMAPALRQRIKPTIELMEALPTVILGFFAGLWLAPFIENNLVSIFMILLVMPVAIVLVSYLVWTSQVQKRLPTTRAWLPLFLIPLMLVVGWLCVYFGDYIELYFFGGDMRAHLTADMGIPFDQRNAMVVGIAMGFAVTPTIFSIAEDAIFSVPKSLSYGSLALGATQWKTLVGVVLPTASPSIFSALMIGFGRAVGETMIVLMATGNTPIMDANIFEGMRTLAANIAIEIPETAVDSSHYRVLFLTAFVLFAFTFVVNTLAEVIRQRLRNKYGSM